MTTARKAPAPANDDGPRRSAIVTARKPRSWRSDVPDMTPEEHQRRGDAADALFREMKRRIAQGHDRSRRRLLAAPLSVLTAAEHPSHQRPTQQLGFGTVGDVVAMTEIEILQQPILGPGHPDGHQGETERTRPSTPP